MTGTCEECRFWVRESAAEDDGEHGYCHRWPPVADTDLDREGITAISAWPVVLPDDWCGEFKKQGGV